MDAVTTFTARVVGADQVTTEQTLEHSKRPAIRMNLVIANAVDVSHTAPSLRLTVPSHGGDATGDVYVYTK